jgi:hypothetical protein
MTRAPAPGPGNGSRRTMYTRAVHGGCPADCACGEQCSSPAGSPSVLDPPAQPSRLGPPGALLCPCTAWRSAMLAAPSSAGDDRHAVTQDSHGPARARAGPAGYGSPPRAPHQPHSDACWRGLPSAWTHGCRPHPSGSGQLAAGSLGRRSRDETAFEQRPQYTPRHSTALLPPCYRAPTALLPPCYRGSGRRRAEENVWVESARARS